MAQPLDVKHLLATGKEFTDSGRSKARQLGTDLVSQARQATEQIAVMIDDLAGRGSRERIEDLRRILRDEVQQELTTLRHSIREDLARGKIAVDRIGVMVNELESQRRERAEELREAVRADVQRELRRLRDSLNEDLAKIEVGVDRIAAVLNEVRSERHEREEELRETVRDEVHRELTMLGLATKDDLAALGRSVSDGLSELESQMHRQVESPTTGSEDNAREPVKVTGAHRHPPTT